MTISVGPIILISSTAFHYLAGKVIKQLRFFETELQRNSKVMSRSIAQRIPKFLHLHQEIFSRSSSSSSSSEATTKFQNYHLRRRRKWLLSPYNTHHQETFNQQAALRSLKQSPTTHLLSSLIDSFAIYNCDPTPDAYKFVIKTLTQTSQLHQLPAVLDRLDKVEVFETPESIFVYLIRFYGRMNMFQEAVDVFFKIPNFRCCPSVDSLDCLLSVLCRKKEGLEIVPQVLVKSRLMNVALEESSFTVLIKGLCRVKKGENAVRLLYHMVDNDIKVDEESFSLILSTLCEQNGLSCVEVMRFLEEMRKLGFCLGRADWGNVIRLLVKNGKGLDAFEALNKMKFDGIKPDVVCYTMAMDGIIHEGYYEKADELFDEMLVLGLVPDIYTCNVFVNGLCKQNKLDAGLQMLVSMEEIGCKPNLITYNTLLRAMCERKEVNMAREVLKRMRVKAVQLNSQTYEIMICGLVSKGEVFEAHGLFAEMVRNDIVPHSSTFDEMVSALCRKGLPVDAFDLFKEMVGKNIVPGARSWEALIVGFKCKTVFSIECFDQFKIASN